MTDYLDQQPIDHIRMNMKRLEVLSEEDKSFVIRKYIKYYIKNHEKLDNLIEVVSEMDPEYMEEINKFLILK